MKVYREVIVKGDIIVWVGQQMFGTKEAVLKAIDERAKDSKKTFGYRVEDFNLRPWDLCSLKEGQYTRFLTVERKKEVIDDKLKNKSILGFIEYEVK